MVGCWACDTVLGKKHGLILSNEKPNDMTTSGPWKWRSGKRGIDRYCTFACPSIGSIVVQRGKEGTRALREQFSDSIMIKGSRGLMDWYPDSLEEEEESTPINDGPSSSWWSERSTRLIIVWAWDWSEFPRKKLTFQAKFSIQFQSGIIIVIMDDGVCLCDLMIMLMIHENKR